MREDGILDEIRTTGGDIRRLRSLLGLSEQASYRYLAALDTVEHAVEEATGDPGRHHRAS